MSYCFNPNCPQPDDPLNAGQLMCGNCGSELLLQNRYRGIQLLGKGGFGQTFEVDDGGTPKVLKILTNHCSKAVTLFQREAAVLMRLHHPGIPKVERDGYFTALGRGSRQPLHCLVMEKIEGQDLEKWLASRGNQPIAPEQAIDWLKQLVEILVVLHQEQYFHRDIKPANIMLKPDGRLVLIDFGAVREVTDTYLGKVGAGKNGTNIGSAGYRAPEQSDGKAVPQSDFFALGRTFVHLLTGKHPVELNDDAETGELIWRDIAWGFHGRNRVSESLADLIDWLMATARGKRPQSAEIILECLEAIGAGGAGVPVCSPAVEPVSHPPQTGGQQDGHLTRLRAIAVKVGLAASLLLGLVGGFRLASPRIAFVLNENGHKNYLEKRYESAEFNFRSALKFYPAQNMTRYNLGATCEKRGNYACARSEYQTAIQGDDSATPYASNNLGRLYITRYSDNNAAIKWLKLGLQKAIDDSLKSDLHKNIGWAYVRETRYSEAKPHLEKALELKAESAPAHCLLAQVLDAEGNTQGARVEWKKCQTADPNDQRPEVEAWRDLALLR
ncbi:serine/threonine-protein kinase [Kamptonema formosum]|uniref:serine/threonine-protein kinase n=1 Tax=Kamptonema formosum TaxID=331992 RepID=UPI00034C6653|nr:serine/threonine-protein kinase [Oscillatoria sp. PCC 10802]